MMRSFFFPAALAAGLFSVFLSGCACSDESGLDGSGATGGAAGSGGSAGSAGSGGTAGNPGDTLKITSCPNPPAPANEPGADVCDVAPGAGTDTLVVGDVLVPGEVFEGGGVLYNQAGDISCVGCDCADQAVDATRIICPDAAVSPGLVNAHDHVGWMNGAPWVASDASVDPALRWEQRHDWRRGKRGNPRISEEGGSASTDEKAFGELRFALAGGTAVFGSGDLSGILRDLDRTGSGDNGLGQPGAAYDTFPLGDNGGEQLASGCGYPDVSGPPSASTLAFAPHVSEGIDVEARNEFLCLTGQGAGSKPALDNRAALVHGIGLNAVDVSLMASTGIDLIWSPRSNISLYGDTAQVTMMARTGVSIGLGTDWLPSGSMNMLRELKCADELNTNNFGGYFSDQALWLMATLGSARALAMDGAIGVLATGHKADIAIFANAGRKHHRAVIDAGVGDVALVLRGGAPLTGNTAVVSALTTGCDDLGDVCGANKSACLSRDIGKSWSALQAAVGTPAYALFFCDTPDNEPSCLPERTLQPDSINGSSLYVGMSSADDMDGDGIADSDDNCPGVFNPIRPLDEGKQSDYDGDDLGDVCDPCPLDKDSTSCATFDPSDTDGDGVANLADNCPADANADQADADADGKGDVCDLCPADSNPGTAGCPYDIPVLKTDASLQGARVAVRGAVVTGVGAGGFFIQKNVTTPYEDNAGVFVFNGSDAKPARDAIIDISGATLGVYYDAIQLSSVTWTDTGNTFAMPPRVLSAAQLTQMVSDGSASVLEGQLIQVNDVVVSDADPVGGTGDTDNLNEFELTGGLRVDDAIWPTATPFIDPFPTAGERFVSITGPVALRNTYLKLLPRDPSDVVFGATDVQAFSEAMAYQRVGAAGSTFPTALEVVLTRAATTPVQVVVTSDATGTATVPGSPFSIAAGDSSVIIPVTGVAAGTTTLRANLQGEATEVTTQIRVLGDADVPPLRSITPDAARIVVGDTQQFSVTLEHPAPTTGMNLAVAVTGGAGTAPATVAVPANALDVSFTFTAAGTATTGTLTVDGTLTATLDIVDVPPPVDIGGWKLNQANSALEYAIPSGTMIEPGGYVIIARTATKAQFEAFFQLTLGANVTYLTAGSKLGINGGETYTLSDASGVVDGPTVAMPASALRNFQRLQPVGAAGDAASWLDQPYALSTSTPGSGHTPAGTNGVYISEFSDVPGTGNYIYEYVELFNDGG